MSEDYSDIKEYLENLSKKLEDRDLKYYWVKSENVDFKPIKKLLKKDIKKKLTSKPQYYRGKNIAEIFIYINSKNINTDMFVMSIKIVIYKIEEDGNIDKKAKNVWGLCINFFPEDLRKIKFSLKLVETLMRLANDETYVNDMLNGTRYTNFLKKLKDKKIKWDF